MASGAALPTRPLKPVAGSMTHLRYRVSKARRSKNSQRNDL